MVWLIAIFAAAVGLAMLLFVSESARRRREVEATFRAIVVKNTEGAMVFKGADAVVHGQHSLFVGGEMEALDGRLRALYLCKNPDGAGFEVVVEGASAIGPAITQVKRLDEAAFQYRLTRFPYRRGSRKGD